MTGRPMYSNNRKVRAARSQTYTPAAPVTTPITSESVALIASDGFVFKESVPQIELRNRRITVAYADLARQLTDLVDNGTGLRFANWCTFAAWSSKTIGATIDPNEVPPGLREKHYPRVIKQFLIRLFQWLTRRDHGSIFRALAAGNRFIFLEIGLAVSLFVDHFANSPHADEVLWQQYWSEIEERLVAFSTLDPSWVASTAPDPAQLKRGMRSYYEARYATAHDEKAEHNLAAGIQLGAYEQKRADGYVITSLSIRGHSAFRRLLNRGTGRERDLHRRYLNRCYARFLTRFGLAMIVPDGVVYLGRNLPMPPSQPALFVGDLDDISQPALQALISRYDRSDFQKAKRGARNWIDFGERMHYIVSMFRSRQSDPLLLDTPLFPPEDTLLLLSGYLNARS
jgi:hypothetical protein